MARGENGLNRATQVNPAPIQDNFTLSLRGLMTLCVAVQRMVPLFLNPLTAVSKPSVAMQSY